MFHGKVRISKWLLESQAQGTDLFVSATPCQSGCRRGTASNGDPSPAARSPTGREGRIGAANGVFSLGRQRLDGGGGLDEQGYPASMEPM